MLGREQEVKNHRSSPDPSTHLHMAAVSHPALCLQHLTCMADLCRLHQKHPSYLASLHMAKGMSQEFEEEEEEKVGGRCASA